MREQGRDVDEGIQRGWEDDREVDRGEWIEVGRWIEGRWIEVGDG